MKKEELMRVLDRMPPGAEVYVRTRYDDAYPAKVRVFEYQGMKADVVYLEVDPSGEHRNFPDGYNGVVEVTSTLTAPPKRGCDNIWHAHDFNSAPCPSCGASHF